MNKNFFWRVDIGLLVPALILGIFSLTTLLSINASYFRSQLIFYLISLVVFVFFANSNILALKKHALALYIGSLAALLVVLLIGFESRGAVRWIDVVGIRIQFSEVLKPFLALTLATYLGTKQSLSFQTFIITGMLVSPVILLIFLQPDLGNAVIYAVVTLSILLTAGFSILWFVIGAGLLAISFPFFWSMLHEYQRQRVMTFFNPTHDPLGSSYNAVQSIIAVGSGQLFGKGLGGGTQSGLRFLPERHTDFIFATFSEEFGLLGSLILLTCFAFLLYKCIAIFQKTQDTTEKLFVACAFFLLLIQIFVNIGMNVGLLPIVGVTLPFVSYGGSSLLASFILLGLVSSVSSNASSAKTLEIGR